MTPNLLIRCQGCPVNLTCLQISLQALVGEGQQQGRLASRDPDSPCGTFDKEDVPYAYVPFRKAPVTRCPMHLLTCSHRPSEGAFVPFQRWKNCGPKMLVVVQSLSCVRLFSTPWTVAGQAPLSPTTFWSLPKMLSDYKIRITRPALQGYCEDYRGCI